MGGRRQYPKFTVSSLCQWRPEGPRSAIKPRLLPASLWALVPTAIKWAVASDTPSCSGFLFPRSAFYVSKWHCPLVLRKVLGLWILSLSWGQRRTVQKQPLSREELNMLRKSTVKLQSKLHVCRKGPVSPMQRDDGRLIMSRLQVIIPYFCFPNFP